MIYRVNNQNLVVRASCPRWMYLLTTGSVVLGKKIICLAIFFFLTLYLYPAPAQAWSLQEFLNPLVAEEMELVRQYQNTPIQVKGRIVATGDTPLSNIPVRLGETETVTNILGEYFFPSAPRHNQLLKIDTPKFDREIVPLVLSLPLTISQVEVPPLPLVKRTESKTRFLFGGDVAMGRRFLDPEEKTPRNKIPPNNPDALIQASHPQNGSAKVLEGLQPLFQNNFSDFRSVNLETPVLDHPKTPHWAKPYSFFTLPESVEQLYKLGVNYVALGNNHLWDYLASGLTTTIENLQHIGLAYSGAGLTPTTAQEPYRLNLGNTEYSLFSFSSIAGDRYPEPLQFVATENQGGAADLRDIATVENLIAQEKNQGRFPIVQLHAGTEYTFAPTSYVENLMDKVANAGAGLIVGHHPHLPQGLGFRHGVPLFYSLGNLVFDSDRLETFLELVALVDVQSEEVTKLQVIPIYLEDYRPQIIGGDLANRFIRRIGEFSRDGVLVYPYLNRGSVSLTGVDKSNISIKKYSFDVPVMINENGWALVDLRAIAPSEASLYQVQASTDEIYQISLGRDLMIFGEVEDWDIDSEVQDINRWGVSQKGKTSFACHQGAHRGTTGICLERSAKNHQIAVTQFRERIRVFGDASDRPKKDLTLVGYVKGENAGSIQLKVRYRASEGEQAFGDEIIFTHPGHTFDWEPIVVDLSVPKDRKLEQVVNPKKDNPRALMLWLRHYPPQKGKGIAMFDDLACVSWEKPLELKNLIQFQIPHGHDFLRLSGEPGTVKLHLTFMALQPKF
ncbi:CapA family protein [Okeania sp.]|uniref:CapA family protein n=1 Tax=Okeania sp. TaxID=3100323 RepID=UPI002B4B4A08|nr:CapA family protein [Okeania sp.]MEB3342322.1 CapA family protein [Okeania sp.]